MLMRLNLISYNKEHYKFLIPIISIILGIIGISINFTTFPNQIILFISILLLFSTFISFRYILVDSKGFKITTDTISLSIDKIETEKNNNIIDFKIDELEYIIIEITDYDRGSPNYDIDSKKDIEEKISKSKNAKYNPLTYFETNYIPNRGNENYIKFGKGTKNYEYEFYIINEDIINKLIQLVSSWYKINYKVTIINNFTT